jgi:glycosyltransferase involved in cell wall biosynthesis
MKLSIITINYNNLKGLQKTMQSVFDQTWKEFEYIIIDGGSPDGSKELIEQNSEKITYWISEPDNGIYHAMNKGTIKAKGEYCLYLNSGDSLSDKTILENTHNLLNNYDIIYGNQYIIRNNELVQEYIPENIFFELLFTSIPHASTFIKKTCMENSGLYDEKYKIVSDWKFFLESFFRKHYTFYHIDYFLSSFDIEGISSDSKYSELQINERKEVMNEIIPNFSYQKKTFERDWKMLLYFKSSKKIKLLQRLGLLDTFK